MMIMKFVLNQTGGETYLDEHDLLEMLAALGISLSMAGGDYEAAMERMKLVYPISVDIGPDIK